MKSKTILILIFVTGLILSSAAILPAKEGKIGFINFQKVFEQSTTIKHLNEELQAKIRKEQESIIQKKKSLEKKKEDLEKQQSLLSEDVRNQKEEELRQNLKDLKRYASDKEDEFQRKGSELMKKILKELNEIVQNIGKEKGYTAILERSQGGVVYFDPAYDITDQVTEVYDKHHQGK